MIVTKNETSLFMSIFFKLHILTTINTYCNIVGTRNIYVSIHNQKHKYLPEYVLDAASQQIILPLLKLATLQPFPKLFSTV